jgi:hypothetical protein
MATPQKRILMADGVYATIAFENANLGEVHTHNCSCWICAYKRQEAAKQKNQPGILGQLYYAHFATSDDQYWGDS